MYLLIDKAEEKKTLSKKFECKKEIQCEYDFKGPMAFVPVVENSKFLGIMISKSNLRCSDIKNETEEETNYYK